MIRVLQLDTKKPMGRLNNRKIKINHLGITTVLESYRNQDKDIFNRSSILSAADFKNYGTSLLIPRAKKNDDGSVSRTDTWVLPDPDSEKWLVILNESYIPDRNDYLVSRFKSDFTTTKLPEDTDKAVQLISNLASRSEVIKDWLANTNAEYSLEAQLPLHLSGEVEASEFKEAQKEITELNKLVKAEQFEKQKAVDEYKAKMKEIETKYDKQKDKILKNKLAKILTMPSTKLPLSLQLAIENYTPAKQDAPNARVYAREVLLNYQVYLIKLLKDNPSIDIEAEINKNLKK